jgi:hypothetical protein
MIRVRVLGVVLLSAALLCSACGSSQPISPDAAKLLQSQVASARLAVAQGDSGRAALVLQGIENTVGNLRAQHMITDRRAAAVLAALGDTQDALRSWVATSTTTTSTTTTTAPPPESPGRGEHGHDKKHGEGGGD